MGPGQPVQGFFRAAHVGPLEAGGRSSLHRSKAIGDSFSTDRSSKTRIAGHLREEAGPFSDHIFLIPEVRRPPGPHLHRKDHWRPKGNDAN